MALTALDEVETRFARTSEHGSYIEPGAILRFVGKYLGGKPRSHGKPTETEPVIFLSSPHLQLQKAATRSATDDGYGPRTLLQSLYGYDVGGDRESSQVIKKSGISKQLLHVSQLWCLLIGSSILITFSDQSAQTIRGDTVSVDDRSWGSEPITLHIFDMYGRTYNTVVDPAYTYVDLLRHAVALVQGDASDALAYELLCTDNEVLTPPKWLELLQSPSSQPLLLSLQRGMIDDWFAVAKPRSLFPPFPPASDGSYGDRSRRPTPPVVQHRDLYSGARTPYDDQPWERGRESEPGGDHPEWQSEGSRDRIYEKPRSHHQGRRERSSSSRASSTSSLGRGIPKRRPSVSLSGRLQDGASPSQRDSIGDDDRSPRDRRSHRHSGTSRLRSASTSTSYRAYKDSRVPRDSDETPPAGPSTGCIHKSDTGHVFSTPPQEADPQGRGSNANQSSPDEEVKSRPNAPLSDDENSFREKSSKQRSEVDKGLRDRPNPNPNRSARQKTRQFERSTLQSPGVSATHSDSYGAGETVVSSPNQTVPDQGNDPAHEQSSPKNMQKNLDSAPGDQAPVAAAETARHLSEAIGISSTVRGTEPGKEPIRSDEQQESQDRNSHNQDQSRTKRSDITYHFGHNSSSDSDNSRKGLDSSSSNIRTRRYRDVPSRRPYSVQNTDWAVDYGGRREPRDISYKTTATEYDYYKSAQGRSAVGPPSHRPPVALGQTTFNPYNGTSRYDSRTNPYDGRYAYPSSRRKEESLPGGRTWVENVENTAQVANDVSEDEEPEIFDLDTASENRGQTSEENTVATDVSTHYGDVAVSFSGSHSRLGWIHDEQHLE